MKAQVLVFGLLFLLAVTSKSDADCYTNHIEDLTHQGVLCEDVLRAHWDNNKDKMCSETMQKRLCCKFCTKTSKKPEMKDLLLKRILEILDSNE